MESSTSIHFKSTIHVLEYLVGMHYVLIPENVVQQLGGKFKVRLLCSINALEPFQCGLVSLGQGLGYISINKKRMKNFGLKPGDEVNVELKLDNSEYGMELSQELEELLMQDDEGFRRFKLLTPGKQRYIIHYVNSVKSGHLRLERAMLLLNNLKTLKEGKESFRGMLGLE